MKLKYNSISINTFLKLINHVHILSSTGGRGGGGGGGGGGMERLGIFMPTSQCFFYS